MAWVHTRVHFTGGVYCQGVLALTWLHSNLSSICKKTTGNGSNSTHTHICVCEEARAFNATTLRIIVSAARQAPGDFGSFHYQFVIFVLLNT